MHRYRHIDDLEEDVLLLFKNSRIYNMEGSQVMYFSCYQWNDLDTLLLPHECYKNIAKMQKVKITICRFLIDI